MAKKISTFWSDFKKFITKGNVIDMAVGVVIGASFGKIVTGLVNFIINPFVGVFLGSGSLDTLKTVVSPAELATDGTIAKAEVAILWGTWLQTIIDFLITALCIFIILRVIMRAKNLLEEKKIAAEKLKAEEDAAKAESDKKAAEAAAKVAAERQKLIEDSLLNQEKLLSEIAVNLKK